MTKQEVIKQKMLRTWPESWKIFEDSCQYSIENNLTFIKGILLGREKKIEFHLRPAIIEELLYYLETIGYNNSVVKDGHFCTGKYHEPGIVFIVFLSKAAIEAYLKEDEKWQKWAERGNTILRGEQPKRPIRDGIEHLSIYSKPMPIL